MSEEKKRMKNEIRLVVTGSYAHPMADSFRASLEEAIVLHMKAYGVEAVMVLAEARIPEFCICAAIRMPDGEVVHGHRHNHCYDVVRARTNPDREAICAADQGFVTSTGRFVDRKEGMRIQRASSKPSCYGANGEYVGDVLFSEDLYTTPRRPPEAPPPPAAEASTGERETIPCDCPCSDAWRCAVARNLIGQIACDCDCHRYIESQGAPKP